MVQTLYGDKSAPRLLEIPDMLSDDQRNEVPGEDDDEKEEDGFCDTLLRNGDALRVEKRLKYVDNPDRYLEKLALCG